MGIPSSMFTVIFAMARTVGWIAHWSEMHSDGMKIARPRQLYTGYENATLKAISSVNDWIALLELPDPPLIERVLYMAAEHKKL